jgi:hypothetical protein
MGIEVAQSERARPPGSFLLFGIAEGCLTASGERGAGVPEALGWLGWSLGCLDRPESCGAEALLRVFAWEKVPTGDVIIPRWQ